MKVYHKTCIFFFFPIINKCLCMAQRSLLSRCPSYKWKHADCTVTSAAWFCRRVLSQCSHFLEANLVHTPINVAVRPKTYVCNCLIAGIASSNPSDGMDVRLVFLVCCVGRGLCDGLITRSYESRRRCLCLIMCDLRNLKRGGLGRMDCGAAEKENILHSKIASSSNFSISPFLMIILSIA